MRAKPLRLISSFEAEPELERQLCQLETNADDAIRSLAGAALPVLSPTNLKTAAYTAAIDELVGVDTSAASVVITLPKAVPQNAGHVVAIARKSASNTLTVRLIEGTVNGAATLALTAAVRLFILCSDGAAWWSTA